jgi:hypothetical protein
MNKQVAVAFGLCVSIFACSEPDEAGHRGAGPTAARAPETLAETATVLYSNPSQGSPVRGAPGEPLFVAGDGITPRTRIYYKRLIAGETPVPPGSPLPTTPTADEGPTTAVSFATAGNGTTVLLPAEMRAGAVYALFATIPRWSNFGWLPGSWSNGVRINDPRPFWVTPSRHVRRGDLPWLPRELKVVGKNLDPMPGASTLVRLSQRGDLPIVRTAVPDPLDRYVARIQLPGVMTRGTYAVSVSRDGGATWVALEDQSFVIETRVSRPVFTPTGCVPNDGQSDTPCIMAAISAAAAQGGGTVPIGAGTWNLGPVAGLDGEHGIIVPRNVSLVGVGASSTIVRRSSAWTDFAVFTLEGGNEVSGIRFEDAETYGPTSPQETLFMLGRWEHQGGTGTVDDVVFYANVFARPYYAITNGFLPIRRLVVRGNEFGAYREGIYLEGPNTPGANRFRFEDSIIAENTFKPGRYLSLDTTQGAMASEIGASLRLDFSDNQADGRATDYLDPQDTMRGFRAAFFFHARNNHEKLLIANNIGSCTGDRGGDGEFIAFDSNGNNFPFLDAETVTAAGATSVSVQSPVDPLFPQNHFAEHWVVIVSGRGVGQARKVSSYTTSPSGSTFTVTPAWDVAPVPSNSGILVTRLWWQALVLGNEVDIRQCLKPRKNPTLQVSRHGVIVLWGSTSDSVVEGNVQREADGIIVSSKHFLPWQSFDRDHHVAYFTDVRSNTVDGESDYGWTCSRGGIQLWHQSTATYETLPMLPAYGVTVANNVIRQADSVGGGGIAIEQAFLDAPHGTHWESTLLFHNRISEINGPPAKEDPVLPACGSYPRVAVAINPRHSEEHRSHVNNTLLKGNTITDCAANLVDQGAGTVALP